MSDELKRRRAAANAAGLEAGVPNAAALIEMLADRKPETAKAITQEEVAGVVRPLIKQLRDLLVRGRPSGPVGVAIYLRPPTDEDPEESRKFPVIAVAQLELRGADVSDAVLGFAGWLRDEGVEREGGIIIASSFATKNSTTTTVQEVIDQLG